MANEQRDPRAYELMTVFIPDMPEDDTKAAIERVQGFITSASGEITNTSTDSPWGRRRLAYTMRFNSVDYRDGYYSLIHFTAAPHVITEIERELKLDTQVIRYLVVIDDPKVGEKDTGQNDEAPEGEESASESAPAEQGEAQEATTVATEDAGETAEAEEAPAVEQADVAPESADESVDEKTAEVADKIEGEENPAPADAPTSPARTASSKMPEDGEGTDWVAGDGTQNIPEGFTLKGNASSKIYHPEESGSYNNTIAEIYFATPEAAERFGYRLPKTLQNAADAAASSVAQLAKKAADAASEEE